VVDRELKLALHHLSAALNEKIEDGDNRKPTNRLRGDLLSTASTPPAATKGKSVTDVLK
jgi:hypothetical protein